MVGGENVKFKMRRKSIAYECLLKLDHIFSGLLSGDLTQTKNATNDRMALRHKI